MNTAKPQRLLSLDTLRGFDMFWIIGGNHLFYTLSEVSGWGWAEWISMQLEHVEWEGFHAFDLVFPLFMFISGVAIPFSLMSKVAKGVPKKTLIKKVVKRVLILFSFGLIYNGGLSFDFSNLRVASVLGQIGFAYLLATLIVLNTSSFQSRLIWFFGILITYAGLQYLIPVPGFGAGQLTPEGSINGWVDQLFLPGRLHGGTYDPEGILCIFSAAAVTLLGSLAGEILRAKDRTQYGKTILLSVSGLTLLVLGIVIGHWYPVVKSIWTSTFNLMAGGISLLLLSLFYLVIDVWGYQKWTFFFRIIGLNSITIYMAVRIIKFKATSDFMLGGIAGLTGTFEPVVLFAGMITLEWLLLYFLYKKEIFLKV
ncbi:MAG: DUF5009 domain-containing protein [Marinilabiliaceae bacterium]|nr:DUF5009 domain-containing protein [Marinilabiliaceae bacterium]